jgi:Patatin-like phospholipase
MGLAGARIAARMLPIRVALAILAGSGCTAAGLGNAPLAHWEPGRATRPVAAGTRSDELLLILAFSGGGTRAAAFAYGVLEELAATPVALGGSSRSLLDEVDFISAVSGGSFTAAYYGLYGDRIFRDFEAEFLNRPVEEMLVLQLFRPRNWVRLASLYLPARGRVLRRASLQGRDVRRSGAAKRTRDSDQRDGPVDGKPVRVHPLLLRPHLFGPVELSSRAGGDRVVGGAGSPRARDAREPRRRL